MAITLTREERTRALEAKKKAVINGTCRVFNNWNKFAGVTKEEFVSALEWLHDDPMTDGKLTRELGCTMPANAGILEDKRETWGDMPEHAPGVDGLHRLTRVYYADGTFRAFADENGRTWSHTNGNVSISCIDRI